MSVEGLKTRIGTPADLVYVMSLMRANRESVGGLPKPAVMERLEAGTVLLAEINTDPVGYLLYDVRPPLLRMIQACIQYDARRRTYGEALVAQLMARHGDEVDEARFRCAADLEANIFWRDMGFTCLGTSPGGRRRGRTLNAWALWLKPRLFMPEDIAVTPVAELRQDCRDGDDSDFLVATPEGFQEAVTLPKIAWANRKTAA